MSHAFTDLAARPRFGAAEELDRFLLRTVDGALAGTIVVVPFLLGGRQALGQLVLVALAVAAALAWGLRQCLHTQGFWRRSAGELLLAAGAVLVLAQIVPLPTWLLERLAPHTSQILPLWTEGDSPVRLGTWTRISLFPAATQAGLVLFLAYGLLFLITVQRIRTLEDVERLLRWFALSAAAMAVFGVAQYAAGNGKFFWVYEHPYTTTSDAAKGGFSNRNHFAHFLALGIGPLIWWAQRSLGQRKRREGEFGQSGFGAHGFELGAPARVLALGIVLFAGLLSLSRGGAIAIFLAVAVVTAVGYRAGRLGVRFVWSMGAVALLVAVSLSIFGHERVSDRIGTLTSTSLDELDTGQARRTIWETVVKAVPDYRLMGSGVGTMSQVYPMYLERRGAPLVYTHAENGYLQVALETGLAGLGLILAGILLCGFWCLAGLKACGNTRTGAERREVSVPLVPSGRMLMAVGAVTAGLAANVVHSVVDFVWYVPACTAAVAVLAACACRLRQLARGNQARTMYQRAVPRPIGFGVAALVLGLGVWMVQTRIGPVPGEQHWFRYLLLHRAALESPIAEDPIDHLAGQASNAPVAARAGRTGDEKMAAELEQVVRWNSAHADAHLRLAVLYLRLFDDAQQQSANNMPLGQIRDAALAAHFASREELGAWLARAVGEHARWLDLALQHARRGVSLCPLLGEGYLCLGELCFLNGPRQSDSSVYVRQALVVRPFDGTVLFHAGREAWLAGDFERGFEFWQRSFNAGPVYQQQLIGWLAGRLLPDAPDQEIDFLLEAFHPDLAALRFMSNRYRAMAPAERLVRLHLAQAEAAGAAAQEAASDSMLSDAAENWFEAMVLYQGIRDAGRAATCGRNALHCDPNHFRARYRLGMLLAETGHLAEAEQHLQWCAQRKPDHLPLKNKLLEVKKRRIGGDGLLATPDPAAAPSHRYYR